MKMKRLALCAAIAMCLAAPPALASTWTGSSGLLWNNGGNWNPVGIPDGVDAIINNAGTATLDAVVPDIADLQVSGYSTLNINTGAALTATGSGNVAVGGAFDEGYVNHASGAVSFGGNLTLGNIATDYGRWSMSSDGTLGIANNLTVGGVGGALFELEGTSILTVGGSIDVGKWGGGGTMMLSGGTLGQVAGGGDPDILADVTVNGGTLAVDGSASTINVASYTQTADGSVDFLLDNAGITPINVSGNMALDGRLTANIAAGQLPAPGIYDLIVSDTGTVTGQFDLVFLGPKLQLIYGLNDDGKEAVRVQVHADDVPIQGTLPGDAYNKIVSMNIKGNPSFGGNPGPDLTPDVEDGAGVVQADNWNNLVFDGIPETSQTFSGMEDNSGAPVLMSLTQNGHDRRNGSAIGGAGDPNLDLYRSQASAANGDGPISDNAVHTLLEGLQEEFPYGYDVIINVSRGSDGSTHSIAVYDGIAKPLNGERDANELANLEVVVSSTAYSSVTGFLPEENYAKLSNMFHDTLDLRLGPSSAFDAIQITGVQVLGLAPGVMTSVDTITDNEDAAYITIGKLPGTNPGDWYDSPTTDAWEGNSRLNSDEGAYMIWRPPNVLGQYAGPDYHRTALPVDGEYEVYVWYSAEDPAHGGEYFPRDSNARYIIKDRFGISYNVYIDQNVNSGQWVRLELPGMDTFAFGGDTALLEYVAVVASGIGGPVSADAVMWRYVMPLPPIPEPGSFALLALGLGGMLGLKRRK